MGLIRERLSGAGLCGAALLRTCAFLFGLATSSDPGSCSRSSSSAHGTVERRRRGFSSRPSALRCYLFCRPSCAGHCRPRSAPARAVDLARLRDLPRLAEPLRAHRRDAPDGPRDPLHGLDGPRARDRAHARPAARPVGSGADDDRARDRAARPAGRGCPARRRLGQGDGRPLRRLRARARDLGNAQPVDPGGAQPDDTRRRAPPSGGAFVE